MNVIKMEDVLFYFAMKYNGDFDLMSEALNNKEKVNQLLFYRFKQLCGDCKYITIMDDRYPESLKNINKPPLVVFYLGDLNLLKEKIYYIKGGNTNRRDVLKTIDKLLNYLHSKNIVVASDYEKGIDIHIHEYLKENKMKNILYVPYIQQEHEIDSFCNIKDKGRLVISTRFFNADWNMADANFLMGLSCKLILSEIKHSPDFEKEIIEICYFATKQNVSIFCIPVSPFEERQGTNILIQNGANLLRTGFDLFKEDCNQ